MKPSRKESGYIYIWMLFAVMLAGVMLSAAGLVWQTEIKREKEQELLFIGDQFRQAIESYYSASQTAVDGGSHYPETLEKLLKDERFPGIKRHLRKIYVDPLTNSRDWGLVKLEDGEIIGVYSLSTGTPIKRAHFPVEYAEFENTASYQDWKFVLTAAGSAGGQDTQLTDQPENRNIQDSATLSPEPTNAPFDPLSRN